MIPATLTTILNQVLTACIAAFAQTGAPTVPSRSFVAHGQPVWEGEQLTVALTSVQVTHPFPLGQGRAAKSSLVPAAFISIEVVRECMPGAHINSPTKLLPDPSEFTDAAETLANDASALFGYLADGCARGTLISSISTSEDVALGQMVPLGPQGLLAGWRVPLTVKLTTP